MKKIIKTLPCLLLFAGLLLQNAAAASFLVPGGQIIGLELRGTQVTVAAFDENLGQEAAAAGLKVGDKILTINGSSIHSIGDVKEALIHSDGSAEMIVLRGSDLKTIKITPSVTDKGPKLGIYLKDTITGVGTISWYDPETHKFGALGHGVSTPDGGLIPMTEGWAYDASIISVKKGKAGQPGQLMGSVDSADRLGPLYKNCPGGIFGTCKKELPGEKLPVASEAEIQKGAAVIRSTIGGQAPGEYSVEIVKIYPRSGGSGRNLLLRITDPVLLEHTGGIVQGMSGSPIIQNGKLVGAVTHVLVNDPTMGYGIFIENMLDAAG